MGVSSMVTLLPPVCLLSSVPEPPSVSISLAFERNQVTQGDGFGPSSSDEDYS